MRLSTPSLNFSFNLMQIFLTKWIKKCFLIRLLSVPARKRKNGAIVEINFSAYTPRVILKLIAASYLQHAAETSIEVINANYTLVWIIIWHIC